MVVLLPLIEFNIAFELNTVDGSIPHARKSWKRKDTAFTGPGVED